MSHTPSELDSLELSVSELDDEVVGESSMDLPVGV